MLVNFRRRDPESQILQKAKLELFCHLLNFVANLARHSYNHSDRIDHFCDSIMLTPNVKWTDTRPFAFEDVPVDNVPRAKIATTSRVTRVLGRSSPK